MLVGRDDEVAALGRLVAGARLGRGGATALLGEPGMGKSSLLTDAAGRAGGTCRVLTAQGATSETEVAFAGLSQLLAPVLDRVDTLPARQRDALRSALALGAPAGGDRLAVGAATLATLTRCAEESPVVVLVDDLHLLDVPSVQALTFAARRLAADPVAMVLAGRDPEAAAAVEGLPVRRLGGVSEEQARVLVEDALGSPVPRERLAELYRRTGGNPLALVELATDPDAGAEMPGLPAAVPEAVARTFEHRVARLPAAAQAALLVAAVADGDLATTTAAARALGADAADLGPAEDAGLVRTAGGRVVFRHPLLQSVAYTRRPATERRAAHRAVADALLPGDEDRRAWHLAESVGGVDAQVARLVEAAAERAVDRWGCAVASTSFERAAGLSVTPAERAGRLVRAAENAWAAGDAPRALALLDEVAVLRPEPAVAFAADDLRATVAVHTGSLRRALEMLVDLAHRAPDAATRARLLADGVHAALFLGSTPTASGLADELADTLPDLTEPVSRAVALLACGVAHVLAGRDGSAEFRAAVPLLEAAGAPAAGDLRWPWVMSAPLFLRDTSGESSVRPRVTEARRAATPAALPGLLFVIARYEATVESWNRAEADYSLAIEVARETGQTTELAASLAGRCWLASHQGDAEGCRADAAAATALCTQGDLQFFAAWVRFALGDLALSDGDAGTAVRELSTLQDLLAGQGLADPDLSPVPELVEALVRTGEVDRAREIAPGYVAAAEEKGRPWALARARRTTGLLADDDVDDAFRAALTLHASTRDAFETARTHLAYGERLRRAGRRVDAREQLRAALGLFEGLGARRWADRTAAELTATGESVQRSGTGWRAELTSQELQVALLLTDGSTTREAAAALYLSPKTVEYHLRKVYTKLDVHSRDELAALLTDGG
ncbi:putative ATPase [Isoptericola jiangsuensis]|uniref:Putative ATPase n=1 Tax=Isoptericola jiangsuensis TaxID=548579 RepID=A0A2A9EX36_9MICO|nr:AAA family ATPase [Isoptericola jiangsuensis]PFG43438.1 putative ATPase [Isoptericola jiangsuensis]